MAYKTILYGAGKRCVTLCKILSALNVKHIIIVDSNSDTWGKRIEGYSVESPEIIKTIKEMYFCITVANLAVADEIRNDIKDRFLCDLNREISLNKLILKSYKESSLVRDKILKHSVVKNKKRNVLFDSCNGFGLGGVEAWTVDVCSALIKEGKEDIYIVSDNGVYIIPAILDGHVIYADINHKTRFLPESVFSIIKKIIPYLPCKIITRDVDDVMVAAYLIKCCYPNMVEIISVIHDSKKESCDAYIEFRECSDLYIGVSKDIKADMIQRGVEPEKVTSMTCPFNCMQILDRTYTENIAMPIRIGYAGRMDGMEHSQKRMDLLLKTMKLLLENNVNFVWELAGDGAVRKEMEDYIHFNKMEDRVKFLGTISRSEIPFFWKRQDICINLSDFEGRSISIIEAMGNGVVPVVTATSGVKEDITDGINGYIVPLGDYLLAVERIKYLEKHRNCLEKMGKLAHEEVYPKSLMETHVDFWRGIFSRKF